MGVEIELLAQRSLYPLIYLFRLATLLKNSVWGKYPDRIFFAFRLIRELKYPGIVNQYQQCCPRDQKDISYGIIAELSVFMMQHIH